MSPLLAPMIALVLWTLAMCGWLYATRISAIKRLGVVYDPQHPAEEFHAQLPPEVRWKADNYNNLMEQPTLFYAVVLTLALAGSHAGFDLALAWAYVALRIAHSFVQALVKVVMLRFSLFAAATFVLLALALRAAILVL